MSLAEAVLAIADDLEIEAKNKEDWIDSTRLVFRSYVKQLRAAVKAAAGAQTEAPPPGSFLIGTDRTSAAGQHATMIEKARREMQQGRQRAGVEELLEPRMVMIVGGSSDGDHLMVPQDMPVGAKIEVPGGEVCVLGADGKLHYSEMDTREVKQIRLLSQQAAAQPDLKSKETV